jgi:hypothetical protein
LQNRSARTLAANMNVNRAAQAGYRRALVARGVPVKFRRVTGAAPNTQSFFADVAAIVLTETAAKAEGTFALAGEMAENDRLLIVVADDLAHKRFPLPLVEGDQVLLLGEWTNLVKVDPLSRAFAGAIVAIAKGIR